MITRSFLVLSVVLLASSASAAPIVFGDRALFESALGSFTVDSLNGITPGPPPQGTIVRDGFTTVGGWYGCVNHAGCDGGAGNASLGFDDSYLWKEPGFAVFEFGTPVSAFGFDYANPACCFSNASPIINGYNAYNALGGQATSGFFGIITDTPITSFVVHQNGYNLLIDNVTYGTQVEASPVPEPSTLALLGGSVLAAGRRLRRRRSRQQED